MKIKDLKDLIKDFDDEAELIMQKDSEGNGYSPLSGVDPDAIYIADGTWSGEVYDINWTAADVCMEEDEWEELKKKPRCVVLYPVN